MAKHAPTEIHRGAHQVQGDGRGQVPSNNISAPAAFRRAWRTLTHGTRTNQVISSGPTHIPASMIPTGSSSRAAIVESQLEKPAYVVSWITAVFLPAVRYGAVVQRHWRSPNTGPCAEGGNSRCLSNPLPARPTDFRQGPALPVSGGRHWQQSPVVCGLGRGSMPGTRNVLERLLTVTRGHMPCVTVQCNGAAAVIPAEDAMGE